MEKTGKRYHRFLCFAILLSVSLMLRPTASSEGMGPPNNAGDDEVVIIDRAFVSHCYAAIKPLETIYVVKVVSAVLTKSKRWDRIWRSDVLMQSPGESPSRHHIVCWRSETGRLFVQLRIANSR